MTSPDSPLVRRFVPTASSETGPRAGGVGDIKAITIHMAEGGGTVSWLARPDGNSSHYVIEYSGTIVQMVPERNWAGSINPKLVRRDNDPRYTFDGETIVYGRAAQLAAVGAIAASDPNRYVIAFEVEGFAATGPNSAQRGALRALVGDIRRRRGPLPCLGHRDWQNYKACPGHRIPWSDYGGHAEKVGSVPKPQPEADVPQMTIYIPGHVATIKPTANVRTAPELDAPIIRVVDETPDTWTVTGWVKGDVDNGSDQWITRWQTTGKRWEYTAKSNVSQVVPPSSSPQPATYAVTVGGKPAGSVSLP